MNDVIIVVSRNFHFCHYLLGFSKENTIFPELSSNSIELSCSSLQLLGLNVAYCSEIPKSITSSVNDYLSSLTRAPYYILSFTRIFPFGVTSTLRFIWSFPSITRIWTHMLQGKSCSIIGQYWRTHWFKINCYCPHVFTEQNTSYLWFYLHLEMTTAEYKSKVKSFLNFNCNFPKLRWTAIWTAA